MRPTNLQLKHWPNSSNKTWRVKFLCVGGLLSVVGGNHQSVLCSDMGLFVIKTERADMGCDVLAEETM